MKSPHIHMRDRLKAAEIVYDRLEGKPMANVALTAQLSAGPRLPPNWQELPTAERARYLDMVANAPELMLGAGDDEDEQ